MRATLHISRCITLACCVLSSNEQRLVRPYTSDMSMFSKVELLLARKNNGVRCANGRLPYRILTNTTTGSSSSSRLTLSLRSDDCTSSATPWSTLTCSLSRASSLDQGTRIEQKTHYTANNSSRIHFSSEDKNNNNNVILRRGIER